MDQPIYQSLDAALAALFGSKCRVISAVPVSGGDINRAYRLTLTDGQRVFLKSNARDKLPMFQAEAEGLTAIAGTGAIRVPCVLGAGADDKRWHSARDAVFAAYGEAGPAGNAAIGDEISAPVMQTPD